MSDLHLEVAPLELPLVVPDADVCVVAGDLCRGVAKGINFLDRLLEDRMPVIYVAGNHEAWKSGLSEENEQGKLALDRFPKIHFLEDDSVEIGGVTFIGATLWTDFQLRGTPNQSMQYARERMNDYRRIALRKRPWTRFTPQASVRLHARSKAFIEAQIAAARGPAVVVTHHAPHPFSLGVAPHDREIEPAYASDLESLILSCAPDLWIHGHTHLARDYVIGSTRVVSNPCGYPDERHGFDRARVVDVSSRPRCSLAAIELALSGSKQG